MDNQLLQILAGEFELSEKTLTEALKTRRQGNSSLGEVLVGKKIITEIQLLKAQARLYGMPLYLELPLNNVQDELTEQVPIQFLKKHYMVPLRIDTPADTAANRETVTGGEILIAVNRPEDLLPIDDLLQIIEAKHYQLVLSTRSAILAAISMLYELRQDTAEQLVQDMEETETTVIGNAEGTADLLDDTADAPIIKLVNNILSQAIKAGASDIHIEPYQEGFKVRSRVDGILRDLVSPPKWIQAALISRIKIMAKLNIAEKRLPQDGRLDVKIADQKIDVRVSTIPTSFGERVVLRLLNKTTSLLGLAELGLSHGALEVVEQLITSPNGIIMVTGPTGSGKTTTLYSVLATINKPGVNIITIEDPVEYQIKGISQIQVNPKIDLTFAKGLRSIVRQDPDVILVGEIRDHETAEIAVQSALTGHLVFSTLHTNDSAGAITRLVDIGVEPFLISSSILSIMAQRLVRVLCEDCKTPYSPDNPILESIGLNPSAIKDSHIHKAVGCEKCFHSGFRSRIGIFEILLLSEDLKSLILTAFDSNQIKAEAQKQAMTTLREDGIQKVLKGITTFEEVMRVAAK
ncbi:MAG: type II secretion system ATPase GspE [Desulfobacterales bacterium]|nr:type II secretion system ATPase GspE [Desulfobacterales bacterium]